MKLPGLKEGMVMKCLTSSVRWWTEGKDYPVFEHYGCLAIKDNDGHIRCTNDKLGDSITFEVIEPPWNGEGYPPVGIDCMVHQGDDTPMKARIDYLGHMFCIYTLYYIDAESELSGIELSKPLNEVSFTPIKTNRQEAIDSIVGNDFTSKALAADLVDEIIAGKHKWLEFTGGE